MKLTTGQLRQIVRETLELEGQQLSYGELGDASATRMFSVEVGDPRFFTFYEESMGYGSMLIAFSDDGTEEYEWDPGMETWRRAGT